MSHLRSQNSDKQIGKSNLRGTKNLYLSKLKEELPEERIRNSNIKQVVSKSKESGIKLITNDTVKIHQQPSILNSTAKNAAINGFEAQEFQQRTFKKFSIQAIITQKNLIKESNYFDESHLGEPEPEAGSNVEEKFGGELSSNKTSLLNFNIGRFEQLQMFQVKTYLFDRNLKSNIQA